MYNYIITENVKRLLRRNYERAVAPWSRAGVIDEARMWASTSIVGIDEYYNRCLQFRVTLARVLLINLCAQTRVWVRLGR